MIQKLNRNEQKKKRKIWEILRNLFVTKENKEK